MTSDGFANMIDVQSFKPLLQPKKLHNMPITSCAYLDINGGVLVTASTDYTYRFTRLSEFNSLMSIAMKMIVIGLLVLIFTILA